MYTRPTWYGMRRLSYPTFTCSTCKDVLALHVKLLRLPRTSDSGLWSNRTSHEIIERHISRSGVAVLWETVVWKCRAGRCHDCLPYQRRLLTRILTLRSIKMRIKNSRDTALHSSNSLHQLNLQLLRSASMIGPAFPATRSLSTIR